MLSFSGASAALRSDNSCAVIVVCPSVDIASVLSAPCAVAECEHSLACERCCPASMALPASITVQAGSLLQSRERIVDVTASRFFALPLQRCREVTLLSALVAL